MRGPDGRLYRFLDTEVKVWAKKGRLIIDRQYMTDACYPVEPVKFRSPAKMEAVFDFDCGLLKMKFRPGLPAFTVSTDPWETESHCETVTGMAALKSRR